MDGGKGSPLLVEVKTKGVFTVYVGNQDKTVIIHNNTEGQEPQKIKTTSKAMHAISVELEAGKEYVIVGESGGASNFGGFEFMTLEASKVIK